MICYHGTPLSGDDAVAVKVLAGRDAMVSFEHPKQLEVAMEVCRTVALDNGAFSAWRRGHPIKDWTPYYEWVSRWRRHPRFAWAVIPDDIDGDQKANNALIEAWPFKHSGVPVWHMHEPTARLTWLGRTFPLVALGSSGEYAQVGTDKWWHRMDDAMQAITDEEGRPMCKLHGLRMLDPTIFSHLPLSSADSTNVAQNMGIDNAWRGPYAPTKVTTRALVIMDRIEAHASAARWSATAGRQRNFELLDCT